MSANINQVAPFDSFAEPHGLRPITDDLLAVIAIQMVEIDALRIQTGQAPIGQRRTFTTSQLRDGKRLGPNAMFSDSDTLVVRLES